MHAKCYRVGDVERLPQADAFPCSTLSRLAVYCDADGRSGVCHRTCLKPGSAPTPALFACVDVAGNANGHRPRYEDPSFASRLLTHTGRQAPHAERRIGQAADLPASIRQSHHFTDRRLDLQYPAVSVRLNQHIKAGFQVLS